MCSRPYVIEEPGTELFIHSVSAVLSPYWRCGYRFSTISLYKGGGTTSPAAFDRNCLENNFSVSLEIVVWLECMSQCRATVWFTWIFGGKQLKPWWNSIVCDVLRRSNIRFYHSEWPNILRVRRCETVAKKIGLKLQSFFYFHIRVKKHTAMIQWNSVNGKYLLT